MSKAEEIWSTLSSIDCNEKTEKKGNLTYLSWAWAWGIVQDHFPNSEYHFTHFDHPSGLNTDAMYYPDGTASVHVIVSIEDVQRQMWLPVMDYRNKSIESPSSRDISDAKMRCLTKCLAMFGLGHYIYAGEDIPSSDSGDGKAKPQKPQKDTKSNGSSSLNGVTSNGIFIAHDEIIQKIGSSDGLKQHWKKNVDELKKLKESHPDIAEAIQSSFKTRMEELS